MFKLVSAIVVLCKELDAMVVAEGIETAQELDAVQAAGARFGQGYLLAKPAFPPPQVSWPTATFTAVKRADKATIKASDSYRPPPPSKRGR